MNLAHVASKTPLWLQGAPDAPDASQMPPRCLPDASQKPPRCLPDASQMPPRCLFFEEKKAPAGAAKTSADFSEGGNHFFEEKKAPAGAAKTSADFSEGYWVEK